MTFFTGEKLAQIERRARHGLASKDISAETRSHHTLVLLLVEELARIRAPGATTLPPGVVTELREAYLALDAEKQIHGENQRMRMEYVHVLDRVRMAVSNVVLATLGRPSEKPGCRPRSARRRQVHEASAKNGEKL